MVQLYMGNGKGKTSAAAGAAVRAAGSGIPVIFGQFLKDSGSGEIQVLRRLPGLKADRGAEGRYEGGEPGIVPGSRPALPEGNIRCPGTEYRIRPGRRTCLYACS